MPTSKSESVHVGDIEAIDNPLGEPTGGFALQAVAYIENVRRAIAANKEPVANEPVKAEEEAL